MPNFECIDILNFTTLLNIAIKTTKIEKYIINAIRKLVAVYKE
jgi:hypothetical protein